MANAPVQVVLGAEMFRRDRERPKGRSVGRDFFAGRDREFEQHRDEVQRQLLHVAEEIKQGASNKQYVKVKLRPSAVAKTHRPVDKVFRGALPVAGGRLGEMLTEVDLVRLAQITRAVGEAELEVKYTQDKETGELKPAPTRTRCEVGAIERIDLWSRGDRRKFDVVGAIEWLSSPRTGHAYVVRLFSSQNGEPERDGLTSLFQALRRFGHGIDVWYYGASPHDDAYLEVMLTKSRRPKSLPIDEPRRSSQREQFDPDKKRHGQLLAILEAHASVREILLPNVIVRSASPDNPPSHGNAFSWPTRIAGRSYPAVGIVDGGLATEHRAWSVYQHGFLAPEHEDLYHGSFIGGLIVAASSLNPGLVTEADGVVVADINIYPSDKPGHFEQYYPNGITDFFDELEVAVQQCRQVHGIRVYNLSLNVVSPIALDYYSLEARRLDAIAEAHDVVFVISAGNLDKGSMRPEWPGSAQAAITALASRHDDQLHVPAESVRNVSVAAVNPSGLSNSAAGAPARYSRRGPGLRTGVKPDLCHVGGSGTACPQLHHGLFSTVEGGAIVSDCGTSFAAPLVARTLATLASEIEGTVSRETLMALAVHNAEVPSPLRSKPFKHIAKQLVGFGQPARASTALEQPDSEITLLFSTKMVRGKTLEFRFTWPQCLVGEEGKCRGKVRLTLVSSPNLDYRYGDEFVRTNVEAALQQENADGQFGSELEPTYVFFSDEEKMSEPDQIDHMFKWCPVKTFAANMPKGRGASSNWRLLVTYLTRSQEELPVDGVPVSILLTISDPKGELPVFQDVRRTVSASGVTLADVRTAARVVSRT